MEDEQKKKEEKETQSETEKKVEDVKDDKSIVEQAREERIKIEELLTKITNERMRNEEVLAKQMLSGKTEGGGEAPKKEEMSDKEYAEKALSGELNTEDGKERQE